MNIHKKVQDIKDSIINGQPQQAMAQLKEVYNDEVYTMTDVLDQLDPKDCKFYAFKLINEAY